MFCSDATMKIEKLNFNEWKPRRHLTVILFVMLAIVYPAFAADLAGESGASGKNLITEDSSFETGWLPQFVNEWRGVEAVIDPDTAAEGKNSLKIRSFVDCITRGEPIPTEPGKTYTFSLYAKAGKAGVKASLGLVNTWKDFQSTNIILNEEWARFSFAITAKEKSYRLNFKPEENVVAWIDAVQFEEGSLTPYSNTKRTGFGIYCPQSYFNLFLSGETVPFCISYYDLDGRGTGSVTVAYRIADFHGKTVEAGDETVTLDKNGRFVKSINIKPEKKGIFTIRAELKQRSVVLKADPTTFAVVNPPVKIKKGVEPFCGVEPSNRRFSRDISEKLGFPWQSHTIHWSTAEREKGVFSWSSDPFELKKRGFKVKLMIFFNAPEWACEKKEAEECRIKGLSCGMLLPRPEELRDFVRAAVLYYGDAVDIWEIGGETDLVFGEHNPYYKQKYPESIKGNVVVGPVADRLAELITVAAREIKSLRPNALVGAIRPSGNDSHNYNNPENNFIFSREVFKKAGKEFDLFPLDPYFGKYIGPNEWGVENPEDLFEIFGQALKLGREYGCNQPVYVSEIGWGLDINVTPDSEYAAQHAEMLTKLFLISRMVKGVKLCMWFVPMGGARQDNCDYGFWSAKNHPLPAVPAYSVVSAIVENTIESKIINFGERVVAAVFQKPDGADAAIWIRGKETTPVTILDSPGIMAVLCAMISGNPNSISIFDVMGNPIATGVKGREIMFEAGNMPVYLSAKGKFAYERLCRALSSAKISLRPVNISFDLSSSRKGVVYIRNQIAQKLTSNVSLYLPGHEVLTKMVVVPPAAETPEIQVEYALPDDFIAQRGKRMKVEVNCAGFEKVTGEFPINWMECKKVAFPVTIDGDLSEWASFPAGMVFNRADQIHPMDATTPWTGPEDLSADARIGWDDEYLYLAVAVSDDKHFNNQEGYKMWNGDSIQFAFGLPSKSPRKTAGYNAGDYELGIALTRKGPKAYRWCGSDKQLWQKGTFAVKRDEQRKKTFYECRIPFRSLSIFPKDDNMPVFGFNIVIYDDDEGVGQMYHYQLSRGITTGKRPDEFQRFLLFK